jgi:hypothetical protein
MQVVREKSEEGAMIILYDFEAMKDMMDRVGEPAELKAVKPRSVRPGQRGLATLFHSVRRIPAIMSKHPVRPRRASVAPRAVGRESTCS